MKKNILFCLLLIPSLFFSQEKVKPVKEITYGNYNHTNRDFLNITLKDKKDNIYLLGSTENDFTFNDIKIIKLDKDLNVLWEKEKTFDLGISYDVIMGGHIDTNNNLILVCRAAYTSQKQTFVVLKYDEDGNFLWDYPLSDLSNPVDYSQYTYSSSLDNSDNLNIQYQPVKDRSSEFSFITLSPSGQKLKGFSTNTLFEADIGGTRNFKILNNNGVYNMITRESLYEDPFGKYMLHRFDDSFQISYKLNLNKEEISFFNNSFNETWSLMKKDKNDNLILVSPRNLLKSKDYGVLNVNPDGTIKYRVFSNINMDKYPLDFGFDLQNNLIIISNNRGSNTSENLKLTIQKYDQKGVLFLEKSVNYTGEFVVMHDEKILVLTDSNKIINFDFDLNVIDKIELNTINTHNFSINNIINIDSNYYLSGYTEDINYSGSVLLSEMDILIKKTDDTKEVNSYRYSGKGTSKIFRKRGLVLKEHGYVFAVNEKLGPDNFSPGGSEAPERQHFVTLNKDDLSILEDEIVQLYQVIPTPYSKKNLTTFYNSASGDIYKYIIKEDRTKVSLFKNNVLEWERDLNLYKDAVGTGNGLNDNEKIHEWKVNKKGDFLLTTYIYGLQKGTFHKYSLENEYDIFKFDELIITFMPLTNDWIFTMNKSGVVTIYSDRLTVINTVTASIYSNLPEPTFLSKLSFFVNEKNNQIILNKHRDNFIRKFNQFGEIQDDYFEIDAAIENKYRNPFVEYEGDYLITLEDKGNSIYLNPQYSWIRAVIKKFDLNVTSNFSEISYDDNDDDGVANNLDECRYTPINEEVNEYGCSKSQTLGFNDYQLNDMLITIFSNPTKGVVSYGTNNIPAEVALIEVYDNLGKKIFVINNKEVINNQKINLKKQKNGIYFLKFHFKNKRFLVKKIIKTDY